MAESINLLRATAGQAPGLVSVLGPPAPGLIEAAQERLGLRFPDAYRGFLEAFGAVEVGTRSIYGIGSSIDTVDGLNVVWHTVHARESRGLASSEIVLSSWDDMTLEVARIRDDSGQCTDGPVRELLVEGTGETLGASFDAWLALTIREAVEDAGR
jgi:hypothetical protein